MGHLLCSPETFLWPSVDHTITRYYGPKAAR